MLLKKRVVSIMLSMSIIGGVISSNSVSYADSKLDSQEIVYELENSNIDSMQMDSISGEELAYESENLVKTRSDKRILIHNNGLPINGNFVVKKNGCNIYAIYLQNVDGVEYRATLGVQDGVDITADEIKAFAIDSERESLDSVNITKSKFGNDANLKASFGDTVKFATGNYTYKTGINKKGNNTYNGKVVSVWDITSFNQGEFPGGMWNTVTRIDVNQPNQHIMSYGPHSTSSGGSGSISLSGPSSSTSPYSWNFNLASGVKVSDSSSLSNKYARWTSSSVLVKTKITSEYGVRVTNAVGNFVVKPSHSIGVHMGAVLSVPVISHILVDR